MKKRTTAALIACLMALVMTFQALPAAAQAAEAADHAQETATVQAQAAEAEVQAAGTADTAQAAEAEVQAAETADTAQAAQTTNNTQAGLNGWVKNGSKTYYYANGKLCTGFCVINGYTYYFADAQYKSAKTGVMLTGFKTIGGKKYYFANSNYPTLPVGAMLTGFCKIGKRTYFFADRRYPSAKTGVMLTGFKTIDGRRYYFADKRYPKAKTGAMLTGFKTIGGKRYYFADARRPDVPAGTTLTGIQKIGTKFYYFNKNGSINTKWRQKLVVLDPGHSSQVASGTVPLGPGSRDRKDADSLGTRGVATRVYEYQLNLTVSSALKAELEKRGYKVLMTRTTNTGTYSCIDRAKVANNNKADIFVRVHANGSSNPNRVGAMTICITKNNRFVPNMYEKSRLLSEKILSSYVSATGCHREYIWKTDTMTGNNWSKVPTTLIELGYMTNAEEDRLMQTPAYQKKMVEGIANGIDAYFAAVK